MYCVIFLSVVNPKTSTLKLLFEYRLYTDTKFLDKEKQEQYDFLK